MESNNTNNPAELKTQLSFFEIAKLKTNLKLMQYREKNYRKRIEKGEDKRQDMVLVLTAIYQKETYRFNSEEERKKKIESLNEMTSEELLEEMINARIEIEEAIKFHKKIPKMIEESKKSFEEWKKKNAQDDMSKDEPIERIKELQVAVEVIDEETGKEHTEETLRLLKIDELEKMWEEALEIAEREA